MHPLRASSLVLLLLALFPPRGHAHAPERPALGDRSLQTQGFPQRTLQRHAREPSWEGVHPELRTRLEEVLTQMAAEGFDMRLAEGFRSEQRQAVLLASAARVTQVGPGRSCHNHGMAADAVLHWNGRASWDLGNPEVRRGYERYGELAKKAGLRWGGDWRDIQDMPHVELAAECRAAIRASVPKRARSPLLPQPFRVWPWQHPIAVTPLNGCPSHACWTTTTRVARQTPTRADRGG